MDTAPRFNLHACHNKVSLTIESDVSLDTKEKLYNRAYQVLYPYLDTHMDARTEIAMKSAVISVFQQMVDCEEIFYNPATEQWEKKQ